MGPIGLAPKLTLGRRANSLTRTLQGKRIRGSRGDEINPPIQVCTRLPRRGGGFGARVNLGRGRGSFTWGPG